jgi:phage-related protein
MLFAVARRELPKLAKQLRHRERELHVQMMRLGGDLDENELKRAFKRSTERLKKKARDHARGSTRVIFIHSMAPTMYIFDLE